MVVLLVAVNDSVGSGLGSGVVVYVYGYGNGGERDHGTYSSLCCGQQYGHGVRVIIELAFMVRFVVVLLRVSRVRVMAVDFEGELAVCVGQIAVAVG